MTPKTSLSRTDKTTRVGDRTVERRNITTEVRLSPISFLHNKRGYYINIYHGKICRVYIFVPTVVIYSVFRG